MVLDFGILSERFRSDFGLHSFSSKLGSKQGSGSIKIGAGSFKIGSRSFKIGSRSFKIGAGSSKNGSGCSKIGSGSSKIDVWRLRMGSRELSETPRGPPEGSQEAPGGLFGRSWEHFGVIRGQFWDRCACNLGLESTVDAIFSNFEKP